MESLRQLVSWIFTDDPERVEVRLRFFLKALNSSAERKQKFAEALDLTLRQCSFFRFFTDVGVTVDHGLWGDIAGRFLEKFLNKCSRHDFICVSLDAFKDEELIPSACAISPQMVQDVGVLLLSFITCETLPHLAAKRR